MSIFVDLTYWIGGYFSSPEIVGLLITVVFYEFVLNSSVYHFQNLHTHKYWQQIF